jgi:hypothetical protein
MFRNHLTQYQPVDLTNIKTNREIKNARDLEKEALRIADVLKNKKNDWNLRLKAI